ncbi:MAG: hypothetical protein M5U34_17505 [Chloroflexi bacterium]|nr:hypothetical protein [Chloroflexota bacterium]
MRRLAGNGRLQIIFSSHEDLTGLFANRGLNLTSVDLAGEMEVGWITAVLDKRLAYFALPDQPRARLSDDAPAYLYERFGHNLRQMEYFLYEVWQSLDGPGARHAAYLNADESLTLFRRHRSQQKAFAAHNILAPGHIQVNLHRPDNADIIPLIAPGIRRQREGKLKYRWQPCF